MTARSKAKSVEIDGRWKVARLGLGTLLRLAFDIRVKGLANVPFTGGAMLAANHVSVLDSLVVALECMDRGRVPHFFVLIEHAELPIIGRALRRLEQVPLRRGTGDKRAVEVMTRIVQRGSLGGTFPEGRLGRTGQLQAGQTGVARIALTAGVPVIPIGIWGLQARWPEEGVKLSVPLRCPVGVAFGAPRRLEGDPRSRSDLRQATDGMMSAIEGLIGEAQALVAP